MKRSATRDSGVPWIGQIRADWPILPAKAVFKQRSTASQPDDVHLTPSQHHGVMPQAEFMALTGNQVVLNLSGADKMRHVEPGDYISHLRSFQGGLEYSAYKGKVSAAYTVLSPRKEVEPQYFRFLFKSTQYVQGLQTTTDQMRDGQSIRYGQFALLPLPYPPLAEQRRIAEFLDRETAQIDDLIAKQEQLIATLAERLAARMFTAVTSGLDRLATLVPSGADWFASRPDTWSVQKLGRLGSVTLGKMLQASASEVGELRPYVRAGNIQEYGLDLTEVKYMPFSPLEAAKLDLRAGDLLVVEGGAGYGRSDVLPEDLPLWSFQNHVIRFRSGSRASARYLDYVIKAVRATGHFEAMSSFATIPNVSADKLSGIKVPVPPVDVQSHIANELDESKGAVDELINAARRSMDLLRERRQALISAAVTGQIDVGGAS